MIKPDEERTKYILELLINDEFDYVWFADSFTYEYEFHVNESARYLNIPETGNALEVLNTVRKEMVPEEGLKKYDRLFSSKRIIRRLKRKKTFEEKFRFRNGNAVVKIFLYKDRPNEILICAKFLEDDDAEIDFNLPEALIIMELDHRKHFKIRNVNEGVGNVLGSSLLKFSEIYKNEAFVGFYPEDRVRAEQLFLEHAKDDDSFEEEFRVGVDGNNYHWIHFSVRVKKFNRSFFYFITIQQSLKKEVIKESEKTYIKENLRGKVHAFDVDLITRTAHIGLEMVKYYEMDSTVYDFPEPFVRRKFIHPDDVEKLRSSMKALINGSMQEEFNIRVKNYNKNEYVWRRVNFTTVFDDNGKAVRAVGYSEDISFLKDQEERFMSILEMCGFMTWDLNVEKKYIINATKLKEATGLTDEFLSDVPEGLIRAGNIHPDDVEIIRNIHKQVDNGEKFQECEFRGKNMDTGKYTWYKLRYTLITDENGRVLYAIGAASDINDQKLQELSYEYEAKTLYEMQGDTLIDKCCVNTTKDMFLNYAAKNSHNRSWTKRKYSEVIREMMYYCANEKNAKLFWDKMSRENLLSFFEQGNKTFSFTFRRYDSHSHLQWVSIKVNMYQDPKTSDIICFIYTYDINRKKLSQEAMELIGIAGFDVVGVIDINDGSAIILHDNDILSRVPNWDCGDYDGYFERFAEKIRPNLDSDDDYKIIHDKIKIASLEKELSNAQSYEVLIKYHKRENGNLQVYRITFRYLDEERSSIVFCMSNITTAIAEERERENILKEALSRANIASRAKTDFLARMSHDIRTPLNGIMGMTQIALEENDPDLIHEYLEKIDTSSHFLLGLLNDILDMSKIEQGVINLEEDVYSLSEFRDNLDSIIVPLCRNKDITLNVKIDGDCSFVTDKQKFNQIFFNLLSNSVKFTAVGGKIDVISENQKIENGKLEIDFIVRDYGCGMSEEFQKHMFEAFTQEKNAMTPSSAGTGLGLAIVKSLVEKMGGTISVWSSVKEDDHGTKTTVHCSLKVAES
ncbi:MAG: PAS domain-containing sensor histidine kinase [Treponema sp.]|nr:PAS domain-containing sensor histidine kinase [Treponema sp.]